MLVIPTYNLCQNIYDLIQLSDCIISIKDYLEESPEPRLPLEYADDAELAAIAVKVSWNNYRFLSERLKSEVSLAKSAFDISGLALSFAPDAVKDNEELVKIAVKTDPIAFEDASSRLKRDGRLGSFFTRTGT